MTFSDDKLNLAKQAASFAEVPFGSIPGFLEDYLIFAGPTGSARTELSILGSMCLAANVWSRSYGIRPARFPTRRSHRVEP